MLSYIILSMRPKQWYKNFLLFAGIIFGKQFLDFGLWYKVIAGFILFCLLSSSVYILNDILDRKRDLLHEKKRNRPIASGRLPIMNASIIAFILALFSFASSYFIDFEFFLSALLYFLLMMVYSLSLKNTEIIDVIAIGTGFVIRAVAGCLIVGVLISPWLILCTFLLALFLAFGKRRHELLSDRNHRQTLAKYSESLLDHFLSMTSASIIISYSLYTFLSHTSPMLMLTIPFVIFGVFRFYFLIYSYSDIAASTELVFHDRAMMANLLLWSLSVIAILHFT